MLGKMLSNAALVLLCIMLTQLGDEDGSIIQQPMWMKMHALSAVYVVDVSNYLADHSREESNGQDSSMVQRPIAITSNQRHNLDCYCPRTFEMAKGSKERLCHQEFNPGTATTHIVSLIRNDRY